jgi:hypothetical protein
MNLQEYSNARFNAYFQHKSELLQVAKYKSYQAAGQVAGMDVSVLHLGKRKADKITKWEWQAACPTTDWDRNDTFDCIKSTLSCNIYVPSLRFRRNALFPLLNTALGTLAHFCQCTILHFEVTFDAEQLILKILLVRL